MTLELMLGDNCYFDLALPCWQYSSRMPIDLIPIKKLLLSAPVAPGRPAFLSAASGLLKIENYFYVVADDELSLGVFPASGDHAGKLFPLFPGELPNSAAERKQQKPDLEALTYLSAKHFPPFGAILAVPSGSTARRFWGALVPLQKQGALYPSVQPIDFTPLYSQLLITLPDLNIEGALILDTTLKLFQRGNARSRKNAVIDIDLSAALEDLHKLQELSARHIQNISFYDLGELHGIPLSFTDAGLYLEKEIWFLAAAEKTDSTYDDGAYGGAVIGSLQADASLGKIYELNCPQKPEGLWFSADQSRREFFVVTDADQSADPSVLYRGVI